MEQLTKTRGSKPINLNYEPINFSFPPQKSGIKLGEELLSNKIYEYDVPKELSEPIDSYYFPPEPDAHRRHFIGPDRRQFINNLFYRFLMLITPKIIIDRDIIAILQLASTYGYIYLYSKNYIECVFLILFGLLNASINTNQARTALKNACRIILRERGNSRTALSIISESIPIVVLMSFFPFIVTQINSISESFDGIIKNLYIIETYLINSYKSDTSLILDRNSYILKDAYVIDLYKILVANRMNIKPRYYNFIREIKEILTSNQVEKIAFNLYRDEVMARLYSKFGHDENLKEILKNANKTYNQLENEDRNTRKEILINKYGAYIELGTLWRGPGGNIFGGPETTLLGERRNLTSLLSGGTQTEGKGRPLLRETPLGKGRRGKPLSEEPPKEYIPKELQAEYLADYIGSTKFEPTKPTYWGLHEFPVLPVVNIPEINQQQIGELSDSIADASSNILIITIILGMLFIVSIFNKIKRSFNRVEQIDSPRRKSKAKSPIKRKAKTPKRKPKSPIKRKAK